MFHVTWKSTSIMLSPYWYCAGMAFLGQTLGLACSSQVQRTGSLNLVLALVCPAPKVPEPGPSTRPPAPSGLVESICTFPQQGPHCLAQTVAPESRVLAPS